MASRGRNWRLKPRLLDAASIGGGAVVGGAAVALGFPVALAVASGAAVWGALRFLALKPFDGSSTVVADGLYETDVASIIADAACRVDEIRRLADRVTDNDTRAQVLAICASLDRILEHFDEDPGDVPQAQRFLSVYLGRTRSIIERYVEYQGLASERATLILRKVKSELLPTLKQLCDQQYEHFLDDDLSDYDTDVEVLKKTIRLENL